MTTPTIEDIRQLLLALEFSETLLVGHDVGGAVAWSFALHHPELLRGLVILDSPHPALFDQALHEDPDQQQASAYMLQARRPDAAQRFAVVTHIAPRTRPGPDSRPVLKRRPVDPAGVSPRT